jgi:putative SOS response-associated peptidase YedK
VRLTATTTFIIHVSHSVQSPSGLDELVHINNRMPVILHLDSRTTWLGDSEPAELRKVLTPFPASEMTSHAVSYDVNHPKIDDEYLTRPVEPNIGVTGSLF